MSFADFMTEQLAEIAAHPELTPEQWIERHAEAFRAAHPVDTNEDTPQ
jgi:hypothetical protein